jgi:hypothetical protein
MANRRTIKGVLHNFLDTYASRYSDYRGYWLFGFLIETIDGKKFDLLDPALKTDVPIAGLASMDFARHLAAHKFGDQMKKAGIPESWLKEAELLFTKSAEPTNGAARGQYFSGHFLTLSVRVLTDGGGTYQNSMRIFVAPHNPIREHQSTRATLWQRMTRLSHLFYKP